MKLPKEITNRRWPSCNQPVGPIPTRPKCWVKLGEASKYHQHDENGNCIVRNWSNDQIHTSPLGGVWARRTK